MPSPWATFALLSRAVRSSRCITDLLVDALAAAWNSTEAP
jgi:hypothetical protein